MGYEICAEKGVVNRGNLYRLRELMRRAERGDRMTLVFLGGSITQGSVSSQYTNCYAYLVYDWFVRRFPKTAFTYVNAGVGGTTSQFGVARVEEYPHRGKGKEGGNNNNYCYYYYSGIKVSTWTLLRSVGRICSICLF